METWLVEKIVADVVLTEPLGRFEGQLPFSPQTPGNFTAYKAFFDAVEAGRIEEVTLALEQGADPNRKNWIGQSALHEAVEHGHTEIVDLLLKFGANVCQVGIENKTALHIACFKGHFQIVSAIVNSGPDLNAQDKNGNTALHEAASKGRAGIIALLLSQGGDRIDLRRKNVRKQEPKDVCVGGGDALKLLTGQIQDPILYSGQVFASLDNWDPVEESMSSDCESGSDTSGTESSEEKMES